MFNAIDTSSTDYDERKLTISIGRVVDTNDPMQMGRVRAYVAGLDRNTNKVGDIPFAIYCSPFAGHQQVQSRGPEDGVYTTGPVAYGMFAIPKVGTDVLIACVNGDPTIRIWFGALFGTLLTGTLPHGRYTFNNPNAAESGDLDGPLSASEQPIQPLYNNQTTAYTRTTAVASNDAAIDTKPRKNFEWRVRGADFQSAALGNIQKNLPEQKVSNLTDDRNVSYTEEDGTKFHQGNFTQGYRLSRIQPNATYDPAQVDGGQNLDPQTYSCTTPGFHSWAMDDRPENCRIRWRTSSGHQVLLDDTNERIYISTADGNNWVEMDQSGNIDIFAARRVSIRAALDVNITTDATFRVYAKEGIHMTSQGEIRMSSSKDTIITSDQNLQITTVNDVNITSGSDANLSIGGTLNLQSGGDTNINSGGAGLWTAGSTMDMLSSSAYTLTASTVNFNGPQAATAGTADIANQYQAYFTNRVPEHEPYGRIMMDKNATDNDSDNNFSLELTYTDPNVGRVELGETIPRNSRWHR